jgi:hypothetical protein
LHGNATPSGTALEVNFSERFETLKSGRHCVAVPPQPSTDARYRHEDEAAPAPPES